MQTNDVDFQELLQQIPQELINDPDIQQMGKFITLEAIKNVITQNLNTDQISQLLPKLKNNLQPPIELLKQNIQDFENKLFIEITSLVQQKVQL